MNQKITINPAIRGGKPTIRGMRITVYDILKMLASGMSKEEILEDFPELNLDDIDEVLIYASERENQQMTVMHENTN